MSDPISSKGWTGDTEAKAAERRFIARTYRLGEPVYISDFDRIADAERRAREIPRELRGLLRLACFAFLSPVLLFCAWLAVQMTTREVIGQDNKAYLLVWGLGITALALAQIVSRSTALIQLRKALMALAIAGTTVVSGGYIYLASQSRANALASRPERTFELYRSVGSRSFPRTEVTHQRADGTLLEGGYASPALGTYLRARPAPHRRLRFHLGKGAGAIALAATGRTRVADPPRGMLQRRTT